MYDSSIAQDFVLKITPISFNASLLKTLKESELSIHKICYYGHTNCILL